MKTLFYRNLENLPDEEDILFIYRSSPTSELNSKLIDAVHSGYLRLANILLIAGASPSFHYYNDNSNVTLREAEKNNDTEMINLLKEFGAKHKYENIYHNSSKDSSLYIYFNISNTSSAGCSYPDYFYGPYHKNQESSSFSELYNVLRP